MDDNDKTKEQLINEIRCLRQQLAAVHFPSLFRDSELTSSNPVPGNVSDELSIDSLSFFSRFSVESSADEVFWMREDSSIVYVNDSACKRLGYSREELQSMHVWDWDPLFTREKWSEFLLEIRSNRAMLFETRHQTKDGELFPVEIKATLMEYAGRSYLFAFVNDISERQNLLARLRSQHAQFEAIFNSITDGVVFVDTHRRIVMVNPGFTALTGYSQEESVGKTMESFYVDPEDYFSQKNLFANPPATGEAEFHTTEYRCKDGTQFVVEVTRGIVKDSKGEIVGVLGFFRDISERVKAEKMIEDNRAKLAAAMASMPDGMFMSDAYGNLVEFNDAWARFCRFQNQEECFRSFDRYSDLFDVFTVDGEPCPPENWATTRALRGESGTNVEYKTYRKDSGESWVGSFSFSPVKNEQGEIVGSLVTARDITEQKQRAEEERQQEDRLRQARKMEAIGTLAGGIAHDFNNILGAIRGYADMAKIHAPPEPQLTGNLDQVIAASDRAKNLVKQILAFSRQSKVDPVPLRLGPLVKEGLKMLRSSIPSTISIVEKVDLDRDTVLADPTQLHQVLLNLCTNAYQAMEECGGTLTVVLDNRFVDGDDPDMLFSVRSGEYVRLSVSDSGEGISPEIVDKIFDPYFSTKEIGKGTGMGLAIVHGIVEECGGAIRVETAPGQGTTFRVYFPVVAVQRAEVLQEPVNIPKGCERILFVDDETVLVDLGESMLQWLGYQVTVEQSSLRALNLFARNPYLFDLVITDQTMPDLTGRDLARKILEIRPEMPIILCTGYSDQIDEVSAKNLGIREYLLKPLNVGKIARMIRTVLDG